MFDRVLMLLEIGLLVWIVIQGEFVRFYEREVWRMNAERFEERKQWRLQKKQQQTKKEKNIIEIAANSGEIPTQDTPLLTLKNSTSNTELKS